VYFPKGKSTKHGESIGIFGHFLFWIPSVNPSFPSKLGMQTAFPRGVMTRRPGEKNRMTDVVKRNKPSPVAQSLAFEVFKDIQSIRI